MNERNLTRKLSSNVVDALKSRGHILVVKGGATALAREVDELMAPLVATIEPRLKPRTPMGAEPTSTFGDEGVDEVVEEMVTRVTRALMESEHVEDVFAEDNVIRRDIFRVVRDGILDPSAAYEADEDATVAVRLDTLGYVAATVSKRGDAETLRQALDQAASIVDAHFVAFDAERREAVFKLGGAGPDKRLELEEAVADELTDLVEQGVVVLPTIERRIEVARAILPPEQRALRIRIESAAEETLLRSGCAVAWEFTDPRTLKVTFTPLSDQDGNEIDSPTSAFARELAMIVASSEAYVRSADVAKASTASTTSISAAGAKAEPAARNTEAAPTADRTPVAESEGESPHDATVSAPDASTEKAEESLRDTGAGGAGAAKARAPARRSRTTQPAKRTATKRATTTRTRTKQVAEQVSAPAPAPEPPAAPPASPSASPKGATTNGKLVGPAKTAAKPSQSTARTKASPKKK